MPRYGVESEFAVANNQLNVSQLSLDKHFKVRADGVHLDLHCGSNFIGAWLDNGTGGQNSLGVYMRKGELPYVMCWPAAGFGCKLPFSFGPMGVQVPHTDGSVTLLSLAEISDIVKTLGRSIAFSGGSAQRASTGQPAYTPEAP